MQDKQAKSPDIVRGLENEKHNQCGQTYNPDIVKIYENKKNHLDEARIWPYLVTKWKEAGLSINIMELSLFSMRQL